MLCHSTSGNGPTVLGKHHELLQNVFSWLFAYSVGLFLEGLQYNLEKRIDV